MRNHAAGTAVVDRTSRVLGRGRGVWTSVAVLGLGAFAIGTEMFVVAGILGGLAGDLGVTIGAAGWTVTAFALAYATGAVLLGALLGTRPARQALIGSLVLFGLFSAMSAMATALPVLLAARVLGGLAASVYLPAAGAAAVAAVPPSYRGRALGVILGCGSIAMVLGAPLGVLLAATFTWRAAFGLVAVLAAITAVGLLRTNAGSVTRSPRGNAEAGSATRSATRSAVRDRLRPMRSPAVLGALGVTFLVMTASNSTYTYLALLPGAATGLGLFIGMFGIGGVAGAWGGGTAADRGGSRRVALLAVTVLATGLVLLPVVASSVPGALAVALGWGMAAWGFIAAQQHLLIGFNAGPTPLVLALNTSATHLGFAAGALLGGLVVDSAGASSVRLLAVACCGAGLLLQVILRREVLS